MEFGYDVCMYFLGRGVGKWCGGLCISLYNERITAFLFSSQIFCRLTCWLRAWLAGFWTVGENAEVLWRAWQGELALNYESVVQDCATLCKLPYATSTTLGHHQFLIR